MIRLLIVTVGLAVTGTVHVIAAGEPTRSPTAKSTQELAVDVLRRALIEEANWVKIHAAESLLALSYGEDVQKVFEAELKQCGDEPQHRIGVWRVLARAAPNNQQREKFLEQLRAAALEPHGPDVLHAVETLAKLGYKVPESERPQIDCLAETLPEGGVSYCKWLLANSATPSELDALADLLEHPEASVRGPAAYALRHLARELSPDIVGKLAHAATTEPPSENRVYLISAAYVTARDDAEAAKFRELLLPYLKSGTKDEKYEGMSALAVRGELSELPFIDSFLKDPEADVRVAAANAALRVARRQTGSFAMIDWLVVIVYGLGMLLIGWWYSRVKNVEDYLLGGRDMNPVTVGISLYATLMSTLTYLAVPGEMISHGPMILAGVLSYPLVYLVVGRFMIPFIMKLKVISAYEILERRFGLSVRLAGSGIFLALRLFWMSLIVYATADVILVPLMGLDPSLTPWVCVVMAVVTIIYTSMGGLQAVVFIDVLQTSIMLAGAILSLAIITFSLGGIGAWWPHTWSPYWDEPSLFFSTDSRVSVGMMIMSSFAWYTCTAGSDQMAIQRYLATRDAATARRMFGYSLCCDLFATSLLAALGLALFAYFSLHPEMLVDGETIRSNADRLLPQFIVRVLPAGIAGLVVAGILSAAMDSLSSGLNSATSVITEDWLDRFRRFRLQASGELRQAKIVSWSLGLVVVILSLLAGLVPGNLLEICYKFVNLLTTPLFILFFMAMFVPWATTFGTWMALLTTLYVAIEIAYFDWLGLSFLWIMPVSLLAGVVVGSAVSLLPIGKRRPMLEMEK